MAPLSRLRNEPWLAGALLLVLVGALVAPVALALGARRWPLYAGLAAALVLGLGAAERWWQSRPVTPRPRVPTRRFRVVPGGKGNGHDHDPNGDDGETPRWLM